MKLYYWVNAIMCITMGVFCSKLYNNGYEIAGVSMFLSFFSGYFLAMYLGSQLHIESLNRMQAYVKQRVKNK